MAEARMALREMGMGVSLVGGGNESAGDHCCDLVAYLRKSQAWRTRRGGDAKVKWSCQASRTAKRLPNRVRMRFPPRPVEPGAGPPRPAGARRGDTCKTAA